MSNRRSSNQKGGDFQPLETDSGVPQDLNNVSTTSTEPANRCTRYAPPSLFVTKPGGPFHLHVQKFIEGSGHMVKKLRISLQELAVAKREGHHTASTATTETSPGEILTAQFSGQSLEDFQSVDNEEARKEFELEVKKALSQSSSARDDYERLLKERIQKMRRILYLYHTDFDTSNLKVEDAERHWSTEKLTKDEQKSRFTKWDATMAEVLAELTETEWLSLKRGGFTGVSGNEFDYCLIQSKLIELEMEKKLTGNRENRCVENYSLIEILERKDNDVGRFFPKGRFDSKTNKVHRIPQKVWSPFRNLLKRHAINYKNIDEDFKNALHDNYTLPKGKLYCRLLLNIASLITFNDVNKSWCCAKMDQNEFENAVFKGVPFNSDGLSFKFPPKTVSVQPLNL
ncbi:hypothetical protein GCK72_010006 [Caenorhabditis remanei]|uniref:Uncharacterized protein n=1 Tax=Caenorhabditis remanei TaxID=31234 RepID=A0A6A5H1R5_CAERE|nr:hypothetical protein GCK72_010006 [Caenorhabditis remanei]KAF1761750.1 hypothetical protein GCK72_010006 [Caenorhabditis remanei]